MPKVSTTGQLNFWAKKVRELWYVDDEDNDDDELFLGMIDSEKITCFISSDILSRSKIRKKWTFREQKPLRIGQKRVFLPV